MLRIARFCADHPGPLFLGLTAVAGLILGILLGASADQGKAAHIRKRLEELGRMPSRLLT